MVRDAVLHALQHVHVGMWQRVKEHGQQQGRAGPADGTLHCRRGGRGGHTGMRVDAGRLAPAHPSCPGHVSTLQRLPAGRAGPGHRTHMPEGCRDSPSSPRTAQEPRGPRRAGHTRLAPAPIPDHPQPRPPKAPQVGRAQWGHRGWALSAVGRDGQGGGTCDCQGRRPGWGPGNSRPRGRPRGYAVFPFMSLLSRWELLLFSSSLPSWKARLWCHLVPAVSQHREIPNFSRC